MRYPYLMPLALLAATSAAQGPPPPPGGEDGGEHYLFISPMGEPFRVAHPERAWFEGADSNHDGKIDRAEFRADAARFFHVLDRNGDGEIDPDEIDIYENRIAPEIRVGDARAPGGGQRPAGGGPPGGGRGGGRHGGGGGGGGGRGGFGGGGNGDSGSAASHPHAASEAQGAARWSYIGLPEPVTAADSNFNRGIDASEFRAAADQRFALLDRNGDGVISAGELPSIDTHVRGGGRHGRPPGGRGFPRDHQPDPDAEETGNTPPRP